MRGTVAKKVDKGKGFSLRRICQRRLTDEVCSELYSIYPHFWQIRNIYTPHPSLRDIFSSRRRLVRCRARGFKDSKKEDALCILL